jgi:hypothetical protein
MILLLSIAGCILTVALFTIFIFMTIYDMRVIRANRHVIHFRRQPLVSIVVDDSVTDASLKSISSGDYRKYEIVFAGEPVRGDLVLYLRCGTILAPTEIRHAVQQLHNLSDCRFVEIRPALAKPDNLTQFFHLYRTIVMAPFISVRAQLDIRPLAQSLWSVMQRTSLSKTWRTYAYQIVSWILSLANAAVVLYLVYLAAWLGQSDLLLLYITAFWLWIIVSAWDYPYLSIKQKVVYTLLAPVSFLYFLLLAIAAPLAMPLRIGARWANKFFSRSVHQTVA